ncbi:ABC transporter ATP-binding protein [Limnothrix sp. FACHB-406]|uniref:ABC transporter ATP-binding protein n=2 Tax=Limnothrix TaxID=132605 RepID=UPI00351CB21F
MAMNWAIETRGLSKQFDRKLAVNQVDLKISPGEVYGLIGPNGAGKTTLIRMLAAVEEPTLGKILIDGEYLTGESLSGEDPNRRSRRAKLKQRIGFLPDDFPVYEDLTVWDYLDYFGRLYGLRRSHLRQRLYEVLDLVQLLPKRDSPIATLSRGMKQRLSLARTIIHEPILLLLDEPVSGLDPIARLEFRNLMRILQGAGMTVLISSHVLSDLAELCTAIGVMELGRLVASAPLEALYAQFARHTLVITALDRLNDLQTILRTDPRAIAWECHPTTGRITVDFQGDETDCADLLGEMVRAQIPIVEFRRDRESLEQIFLKLGHQQAS